MAPYTSSTSKASSSKSIDALSRSMARIHIQREQAAAKAHRSISGFAHMRRVASGGGALMSVVGQRQRRMIVPRHLFRPIHCCRYGTTNMTWDGKQLLASLARSMNMKNVPAALAQALDNMTTFVPPTHVLAIRGPNARHSLLLYPVHDHVLRVQCPRLGAVIDAYKSAGGQGETPMVPVALPVPQLFSSLLAFLYTRDDTTLIAAVFPELANLEFISAFRFALSFDENVDLSYTLRSIVDRVSCTYSRSDMLLRLTIRVAALYRDACHIGICDGIFWRTLEWMWYVVVTAIRRVSPSA